MFSEVTARHWPLRLHCKRKLFCNRSWCTCEGPCK